MAQGAHTTRPAKLLVGTSGFSYSHWRDDFYAGVPPSHWLEHYAERFCTVELNVSFYRLPTFETFAGWNRRTPAEFDFSVKGSRTITHYRRLRDASSSLERLFAAASGLGEKLACFLWQLPPKSSPDLQVLEDFCSLLPKAADSAGLPKGVRHAFEFRDGSWFGEDVLDVLERHGHALVLADPPRHGQPSRLTADFTYLRFHHGPRPGGAYDEREISRFAGQIGEWLHGGTDVFAYFNNDPGGWAPRNAERLLLDASGAAQSSVSVAAPPR